jgi:hypothetical protein
MGARQYVQDEKIQIARRTITKMQYLEKWPDEYSSYITRETRNNRYKDPERFFRVMHYKPEWYARRFIFRPIVDVAGQLKEAARFAMKTAVLQAGMFRVVKGLYLSSFKMTVNGDLVDENNLNNLTEDSVIQIYNTAPYAAKLESIAFYRAKMRGVLYFAAMKLKKKYPYLGISFSYKNPGDIYGSYSTTLKSGKTAYYAVPVLTIGSRKNVIDTFKKPGYRVRRAKRAKAKLERIRNKVRT